MRIPLPLVAAALLFHGGVATAQSAPAAVAAAPSTIVTAAKPPVPQPELDFLTIIDTARKKYAAARSIDGRRDARVSMQIAVLDFMNTSNLATDWVGVFKDNHRTNDGRITLEIEIAPNVRVATWGNTTADKTNNTLFQPYSEMGKTALSFAIGDEVKFSGRLVGSIMASDDDMVLRPRLVARFQQLAVRGAADTPKN